MKTRIILYTLFCMMPVLALAIGGPTFIQQVLTEEQKINQLITYIEKSDATFIRNGNSYTGAEAAKHLRMKRQKAGDRIKTARDFIDYVASKSTVSGEAYQIQFKNGAVFPSRDVLYYELKKIESAKVGINKYSTGAKAQAC